MKDSLGKLKAILAAKGQLYSSWKMTGNHWNRRDSSAIFAIYILKDFKFCLFLVLTKKKKIEPKFKA